MVLKNQNHCMFYMKFLNKNNPFLSLFVGLMSVLVFSQNIQIKDSESYEPIPGVVIFNNDQSISVFTDFQGQASLAAFQPSDSLSIMHIGYVSYIDLYPNILSKKNIFLMPNTQQLEEIVLSVARTKEGKERIAKKVSIITRKNIENNIPQTSADILRNTGGVRIQKSQGGGGSPVIRGFEANRVLLVIDGVRMNNAIYRSGHLQNAITIDPNSLERTEVIFGPASVGYGSDALGGVVHYYTREAKINGQKKWKLGGSSSYNASQKTNTHNINAHFSQKKWGSFTSISFANFGDVVMGKKRSHGFQDWGLVKEYSNNTKNFYSENPIQNDDPSVQKNSGYHQLDILQKWGYQIHESMRLNMNAQYSQSSNVPRFDKLAEYRNEKLRFAEWNYGPQKRLLLSPQLKFASNKKWLAKGTITGGFQHIEESRITRKFESLMRCTQKESVDVYSVNADFFAAVKDKRSLSYGFEFTHNEVRSKAYSQDLIVSGNTVTGYENVQNIPTRYPSAGGQYSTGAFYTDYRQDISQKSTFNMGGRFTYTRLKAIWNEAALIDANLSSVSSKNTSVTATIGYVFRPNKNWQLNSTVSSGFRSPNIDDLGKIRESNGSLSVPNPHLKSEYAYNTELGIVRFLNNKKNSISINAYHSWIRDYIGRASYEVLRDKSSSSPNTIIYNEEEVQTIANVNLGNASMYGGTIDVKSKLSNALTLTSNLTYTMGSALEDKYPLPSVSPLFGNFLLQWNRKGWNAHINFQFSEAKSPEDYSLGGEDGLEETPIVDSEADSEELHYNGTPAWNTFQLGLGFQITPQIKVQGFIENLFDVHYREFASGISAPGRSFTIVGRFNL